MKSAVLFVGTALTLGAFLGGSAAQAAVLVSTIYGVYDANSCGNGTGCLIAPAGEPLAANLESNAGGTSNSYDTPSLFINNNTPYDFTNVSITLSAYQGINAGSVTVIPSGTIPGNTIPANTLFQLVWSQAGGGFGNSLPAGGSTTTANLYTFDYDDYYLGNLGLPGCAAQGPTYCEKPGNFDVTFTATWDNPAYGAGGTPISAVFSPDNTQGPGNAAGTFVGWEGLDPTGLAETIYDNHTGAETGVLANIVVGTPAQNNPVPEPSSVALIFAGLGALGLTRRRRGQA
jgi:hypothetical protein